MNPADAPESISRRVDGTPIDWPPLPDYGIIARYPATEGTFIHPGDEAVVRRLVPSERVLCRHRFDGDYYHYRYGPTIGFRLKPVMWTPVAHEGVEIGDRVETVGRGLERERFVASIRGIHFIRRKGHIVYRLRSADGRDLPRLYRRDWFQLLRDKATIREGSTVYAPPRWLGRTDDRLQP